MAGRHVFRLARERALDSGGFLLIETLLAISIFAIVAAGLVNVLVSSTTATTRVKQQTVAEEAVMNQIEKIRAMDYNAVGTVNGCVPGTLSSSTPLTGLNGASDQLNVPATLNTTVGYAGAGVPGTAQTGADYKEITVWVTRNSDGKTLAQATTNLAPKNLPSQSTATIKAAVSDYGAAGTPMQGVQVNLATGPSAPESCTTDASGSVTFPGLTPNPSTGAQAYYDLSVTPPAGYQVLSDDAAGKPPVHNQLSPTQFWQTSLSVYKPATIVVDLLNPDGTQFTGSAAVTVTSNDSRTAGIAKSFAYSGIPLSITNVVPADAPYLVPGQYSLQVSQFGYQTVNDTGTVPAGYPTTLTSTFNETMTPVVANGELDVTVQGKKSSGATITCTSASVTIKNPNNVSTGPLTTSSGTANFTGLVPGSPYSVTVTDGARTGSASSITVVAGPTKTTQTILLSGTGNSC
jgi:type II secretory pathway pseudopilin PulG